LKLKFGEKKYDSFYSCDIPHLKIILIMQMYYEEKGIFIGLHDCNSCGCFHCEQVQVYLQNITYPSSVALRKNKS